jgi:ABC-type branched-subunit amino acid transport system permease subunit
LQTNFPNLFLLIVGLVLILAITFMPDGIVGIAQQLWRRMRGGRRAPA